jgi:general nucleoside transport system permease protein
VTRTNLASELRRSLHLQPVIVPLLAIVLAFATGALAILAIGNDPIEAYTSLVRGMFGTSDRIAASLGRSTPFIGAALAVAFAFRCGLFNIGAEGQLLVGATAAAWVGTWSFVRGWPGAVSIPVLLSAGIVAGMLYGGIPGALKARTGAHEVIVTIMLNAIALLYVRWMVSSQDPLILRDPGATVPRTSRIDESARLPSLVDSEPPLHLGFFIMVALAILAWFVLQRTTFGFEVRTVGTNTDAARYAGMGVGRTILVTMAMSGAFAGLAGAGEISGTAGFLSPGVFVNIGFDSIAIALLARANPFAIIPAAILWGSMLSGAGLMQQEVGLSIDVVRTVQALVLLFVAADVIVRTVFRIRKERATALDTTDLASGWGST